MNRRTITLRFLNYIDTLVMYCLVILTLYLSAMSVTLAGQNSPVFDSPQDPNELAAILFPNSFRTLVVSRPAIAASPKPSQDEFGVLVNFKFDSTIIVADSLPLLDSVGEALRTAAAGDQPVVIEGHTDASGSDEYNQELSERRARAIKRYFVSIFEIDPNRLHVLGSGERSLYARDKPFDPINRRVTFRALDRVEFGS